MKTKKLFLALFAFVALIACSEQENSTIESLDSFSIAKQNWQERTLTSSFFDNQSSISHYSFSKKDLLSALSTPDLDNFRFVLGLQNDQIIINLVGVNRNGEEIVSITSDTNVNQGLYKASIASLENNSFQYSRARLDAPFIGKHLLTYDATFQYINNWNKALTTQDIEELITDSGTRFRYYSLEKEVLADMVSYDNIESVALFLGLNTDNKLTTVFLKKDVNDLLILNTTQRSEGGDVLDFTHPCPDWCPAPKHCICEDGSTEWYCCPKEDN